MMALRLISGQSSMMSQYAGVEIEVNQRYVNSPQWKIFSDVLANAVGEIAR